MNTTLIASVMITGLLKPGMILLVIAALWFLLRKKSAALQHFVLSLGVLSILVLPLLTSVLPVVTWKILPPLTAITEFPLDGLAIIYQWAKENINQQIMLIVLGLYLVVATSILFYLLLGIIGLVQQTKTAELIVSR